ncbi:DUF1002 domain-containing protein [Ruminococcus sp. AF41-9]|jgi:uncharacterized protein YpuA (DUF1002 family)|nr:DUF1002 domain-containing protein [Ruminococcus sp. AF41-9]
MKKAKSMAAILCGACLVLSGTAVPTMADSMKVVTLGADLSDEQKNTMMRYFNVDSSQVQILTITNQDERDHLSAYVPLEQIGTRTVSCAYVKPTQSGGIKVRTANLNWVTCNMIATSLSTSGVKNCEVVAACPFEVSGTGALTGIQMAYETATGEQLDSTKKELATEEMVVTGTLADEVGKNDATTVMNNSKMQVIKDNVQNVDDIYNIVINVAQENNVTLDSDQIDQIVNLLQQIAQQDYNYDDVKATLEQVNQNTSGSSDEIGEIAAEEDNTVEAGDSADGDDILNNVDNSVLGGDVVQSSTENPTLEQETGLVEDNAATDNTEEDSTDNTDDMEEVGEIDETDNWDETTDDSTMGTLDGEETTDDGTLDADSSDQNAEEVSNDGSDDTESYDGETTEELDTSSLTEDQMALFNQAENFCKGEYEGDTDALITAMEDETASASVTLDAENGATLSREVEKAYLKVLTDGTDSYQADGTEIYMSTELNMVDKSMKEIFGLSEGTQASPELSELSDDERQTLYNETMKFFEKLYGESSETYNAEDAENTESAE